MVQDVNRNLQDDAPSGEGDEFIKSDYSPQGQGEHFKVRRRGRGGRKSGKQRELVSLGDVFFGLDLILEAMRVKHQGWIRGLVIFLMVVWYLGIFGIQAAPVTQAAPETQAGSDSQTILVQNTRELLQAIGTGRIVRIQPGVYDLAEMWPQNSDRSFMVGKGSAARQQFPVGDGIGNQFLAWEKCPDGYQLILKYMTNCKLEGVGGKAAGGGVKIVTAARDADVFRFEDCYGITIANVEFGHGPAPGDSRGGGLRFYRCREVAMDKLVLYGGTEGLNLFEGQGFKLTHSVIRDCTRGMMTFAGAKRVTFENCTFENNRGSDLINLLGCGEVLFQGCMIRDNAAGVDPLNNALFRVIVSGGVVVKNTIIRNNRVKYLVKGQGIQMVNVKLEGNTFKK